MVRQRIAGLIVVGLMTLTGVCVSVPLVHAVDTSTVSGLVTAQGNPVNGATVRLLSPGTQTVVVQTTSDPTGHYVLTANAGTYDVVAFGSNGLSQRVANQVLVAGSNNLDFTLQSLTVTVSGVVKDPFGNPWAMRGFQISCDSNPSVMAFTDATGHYSVNMLPGTNCRTYMDIATNGNPALSLYSSVFSGFSIATDTTVNFDSYPTTNDFTVNVINPDGTPAAVNSIRLNQNMPTATLTNGMTYSTMNWNIATTGQSSSTLTYIPAQLNTTIYLYVQLANGLNLYRTIDTTNGNGNGVTLLLTSPYVWLNGSPTSTNDGDSVADAVEALAPNQGDGNGDGLKDYEQANVTSYPATSGNYVTLAAPASTLLTNVQTVNPTSYNPPAGYTLPEGLTDFKLEHVTTADVTFKIFTASTVGVTGYAKYRNGQWSLLPQSRVKIFSDRVEITLTDGGIGDDDGVVNGTIVDPGGLVIVRNIYQFGGFREPITAGALNTVKAGSAVPVKWRITDAAGNPVSDPASFTSLTSLVSTCNTGLVEDAIETTTATNTGLQYLGNGVWQFIWKTAKTATGCRQLRLTLADGSVHTAAFAFR